MASVFLSYDHEDAIRASPIASALEKAGHSVWWDRHIHGGAEYNSEIEGAVERADAVVVLWSERSVKSAWVRDEAAEGRDSGKLVPVLIDGVKPPMGFRQYQTVDLAAWKGGKQIPKLAELLHAIERVSGSTGLQQHPARGDVTTKVGRLRRLPLAWIAAAAIAVGVAIVLFFTNPFRSGESAAIAAVVAADSSAASQDFARDLLAKLGRLQSAGGAPLQLTGESGRKGADFIFEIGGVHGQQARANLVLLDGRTATLLWSKDFERPAGESGDLRQELGYTAAQVLGCAREAHAGARLTLETLKLYLTGCAMFGQTWGGGVQPGVAIFRRIVDEAPRFEGAWGKLLLAQSDILLETDEGRKQLAAEMAANIAAARKLNPDMAEAYDAEIALLPPQAYAKRMRLAERAVERNPDNPVALAARARVLESVGRPKEAIGDARLAMELDPLSPARRASYIYALAQAGQKQAALEQLNEAERLWPGARNIAGTRFSFNLRYGDPAEALRQIESGLTNVGWTEARSYLEARSDPTPAKVAAALRDARRVYSREPYTIFHLAMAYGEFDREKELLDLLLKAPLADAIFTADVMHRPMLAEFWHDPRSLLYAKRVGLLQYWQSSGKWPDFCFEPEFPYDCKKEAARLLA